MESTAIRSTLRDCEVFKGFDDAHLDYLIRNGRIKQFAEGRNIYQKGEAADGTFCFIVSGTVNVISEHGEILQTIGPQIILGEIGTVSPQSKRTITVRAAQPVEALEWNFEKIQKDFPELFERLRALALKRTLNWYY